ncbi:hypothetical protein Tco_1472196, partial [Tanacetum coccineum]
LGHGFVCDEVDLFTVNMGLMNVNVAGVNLVVYGKYKDYDLRFLIRNCYDEKTLNLKVCYCCQFKKNSKYDFDDDLFELQIDVDEDLSNLAMCDLQTFGAQCSYLLSLKGVTL